MAKRSIVRFGFGVGALCVSGALAAACGGLNSTHVVVTDDNGGNGGSAGSALSGGGSAGKSSNVGGGGASSSGGKGSGGSAGKSAGAGGDAGASAGGDMGGTGGAPAGGEGGRATTGGAAGSGGAPSGGSSGTGGAPSGGAGGSSGGAAGTGGAPNGPCNALTPVGASIPVTTGTGNPPAMTRGAITAGTYSLTKQTFYNGMAGSGSAGVITFGITVNANIVTIQEVDTDPDGITVSGRQTWRIDTSAVAPLGVSITCSSEPSTPLNADLQVDWTATSTTFEISQPMYFLYEFKKQ